MSILCLHENIVEFDVILDKSVVTKLLRYAAVTYMKKYGITRNNSLYRICRKMISTFDCNLCFEGIKTVTLPPLCHIIHS